MGRAISARSSIADARSFWSTATRIRLRPGPGNSVRKRMRSTRHHRHASGRPLARRIPDAFKPVDILVNNAGHDIGGRTRFDQRTGRRLDRIIRDQSHRPDARHARHPSRHGRAKRRTHRQCVVGQRGANLPDMAAYSTSKAGVHMFTETIRGELADTAIRVTEIQPGLTRNQHHHYPLSRRQGQGKSLVRPVQDGAGAGGCRFRASCLH